MKVRIQQSQIHHYKEQVLDGAGIPTGELKDVLQLDVQFPEHPDLSTMGIRVEFPISKQKVLDAIRAKAQEAKAQVERDIAIRELVGTDILEFNIEV